MVSSMDARDSGGGESSATGAKRAANVPITAGAFGFHFATPAAKKPRVGVPNAIATTNQHQSTPSHSTPRMLKTPMTKVLHALDSLPSPLQFQREVTPRPGPTGKHKLNSVLDEISPFRAGTPSRLRDGGVSLGQLPGAESMSSELAKRKREVEVKEMEEDGIGVSPRKVKDARWAGKGPLPLAPQLASLLRGTESSLILFYSSLQRRLAPPRSPAKTMRQHSSAQATSVATLLGVAQTATLIIRPIALVQGPTHQAIMVECQKDSPLQRTTGDDHDLASSEILPQDRQDDESASDQPQTCVIFQNPPQGCPRVGVDPGVMAGKMREGSGTRWEGFAGIWSPWTERLIQLDEGHPSDAMEVDGRGESTSHDTHCCSRIAL